MRGVPKTVCDNLNPVSSLSDFQSHTIHRPLANCRGPLGCWYPRQFSKVVILLIDALRFDFIFYNQTLADLGSELPTYANKLLSVHRALQERPRHSRLFRFVADAPTVTMQRLKGLTTGGLPTFIDVGSNFQSSAVREDSWVSQLARSGRRVVHMVPFGLGRAG